MIRSSPVSTNAPRTRSTPASKKVNVQRAGRGAQRLGAPFSFILPCFHADLFALAALLKNLGGLRGISLPVMLQVRGESMVMIVAQNQISADPGHRDAGWAAPAWARSRSSAPWASRSCAAIIRKAPCCRPRAISWRSSAFPAQCLREVLKTLAAKGLVVSKTRVGTKVRNQVDWNMFDSDLLGWRLDLGMDLRFLNSLYEIRLAVEPAASALAALRRSEESVARMRALIDEFRQPGHSRDRPLPRSIWPCISKSPRLRAIPSCARWAPSSKRP